MLLQPSRKSKAPSRPASASRLLLLLILASCTTPQILQPLLTAPVAPTSATTIPLGCFEFHPMTFNIEKPNVTVADVLAALALPDNPLGHARAMLGDTLSTRAKIDVYAAEREYLGCPDHK